MKTKTIQITADKGPAECCWVVAQVLKYIIEAAKKEGITHEILYKEAGAENRTLQSVSIQFKGKNLEGFLKDWLGTIQWIGQSTFRKFHKRKNWFIGIYALDETETITLSEKYITFQAMRSSGPGGQHVNKVSSAIRATHKTTGLQVVVMDSRSQHQNKRIAIQRLQQKVAEHNKTQLKQSVSVQWENHLDLQRGNPVKVFKGSDFKVQKKKKDYKQKRQQLKKELRRLNDL